jgi:hypothetical protein
VSDCFETKSVFRVSDGRTVPVISTIGQNRAIYSLVPSCRLCTEVSQREGFGGWLWVAGAYQTQNTVLGTETVKKYS